MTHTLLKNTPSAVSLWRYYRIVTALLALAHEAQAGTASINFSQSGSAQTWTVPAGVSSASVTLTGAKGGRGANDGAGVGGNGGNGGRVTGTLALTPGETLTAHVGAAGADGTFATSTGGGAGGAGGGGAYAGGRGGHAGSVGASGGGGGGGGAAALLRGATLLAVAGGAGGGGGAGGSTEWFFSDNQANRDGLTGYSGGYTTGNVGTNGADRGSGNDGGGGGGGGGGYSRGGLGGTLRKTGNNNTGGNGGSAGENYSSGLTSASSSYIAVTGHASVTLSYTLPAALIGAFDTAATVPYQLSSIDLTGSHALSITLGHAPTPGEVLTLVNNIGASAVTGTFTGLPQGSTVTATYGGDTYRFTLSYTGGTGNDITLTRSAISKPAITVGEITYTGNKLAVLHGAVNPGGFNTTVVIEYGATTSYGTSTPVALGTPNATTGQTLNLALPELAYGTYHYRITASNIDGSASSSDGVFSLFEPSDGTTDASYLNANGSKLIPTTYGFGYISSSAFDTNGRLFGVGFFDGYDTVTGKGIICLNSDGTPDAAFHANLGSGFSSVNGCSINAVLPLRNGKILVGGQFDKLNGATIKRSCARLNADGTPDTAYNTALNNLSNQFGFNTIVEQPDGKIIGDSFGGIRRLNVDGTIDSAFGVPAMSGIIRKIALQADGKILVGGVAGLKRFNPDGTEDTAFNSALGTNFTCSGGVTIRTVMAGTDGRIWVGGDFTNFNNQPMRGMLVLNPDGSVDSTALAAFGTLIPSGSRIADFLSQRDGKVVIAGFFTSFNGKNSSSLARLNADGSPDTGFTTKVGSGISGGSNSVMTLASRPTGELIVGGYFTSISGKSAKGIAQLSWSGSVSPATQTVAGTYGSAITPTSTFTTTRISGTTTYTVSPALPSGLSLDSSTGVISGTPRAVVTTPKTYTLTATGSTSGTATSTLTLSVAKAPLTITANNTSRAYGASNPSFGITITGLVNGDTASAVSGAPSYACAATTSSAPGSYVITPSLGTMSAANYSFPTFTAGSLTVEKAMQTLSIAPLATAVPIKDLSSVNLTATSSAGLPVTLSLDAGSAATLTGSVGSYALTDIGQTGTVTVRASQSGNANYSAAQDVVVSFDVTKSNQTITFAPVADKTYGDASFDLSASASSSLPVSFTLVSGPAALQGSTVTLTGAGTIVIRASQAGNDFYNEAAAQTCSFIVAPAAQTITFGSLAAVTYGDAPFALAATADSGLAVTYSIVSGPAALNGGNLVSNAAGTVVIRASQAGDDNHLAADPVERTLTVNRKALTVTGATAIDKTADTTTAAQIAGAQLAGVIDGDEVLLANSNAGSFSQATPGTNLPVTTSMTLEGADAGNYTLTQPALTATITAAEGTHTHQEDWRNTHFATYASEADAADDADPDHDGMSNLMEYALGQDPNASGVIGATLAKAAGNLEYTYTRSTGARENGAAYQIEWSDTLEAGSWSTQNVTEQIQGTQGALETVKATIPAGSGTKRFLRLQVVK